MTVRPTTPFALAAVLLCSGCATYLEARQNTAPGGAQETAIGQAAATLSAEAGHRTALERQATEQRALLQAQTERIARLEGELAEVERALDGVRAAGRVIRTRAAELQKQLAALRAAARSVEAPAAAAADPERLARLAELETRKATLEAELARLLKP